MICRISSPSLYPTTLLIFVFTTIALIILLSSFGTTKAISVGEPNLSAKNPFGGGPPEIIMTLDGIEYPGELRYFKWDRDVNDNLPAIEPPRANITSIVPNSTATIEKGSQVKFSVKDNPSPEVQPDSLSVTAYTLDGYPSKVLGTSNDKTDTFDVELDKGRYILLAVATWIPNEGNYLTIGGIVSRTYSINVTDT